MLTRADFDVAVKEALRHYTRADLLLGSPLLETRIAAGSGPKGAQVARLQQVLTDTAQTIFVNERDRKLQRVLELTYFRPVQKQEAAAERLGLSFSTYRRHLTAGLERLTEWLWQREQEAQRASDAPDGSVVLSNGGSAAGQPAGRPRLSVVVLPFLNLSQDPNLDYLVDGIVDNLLTDLSRALPGSFVVSRSTAFTYKGRKVPARQIGEELHVRYILEGSVLANAERVRVNAQLIDAETDEHLWAERFDKERRDMLEVQDEIVARLARTVGVEMVRHEGGRHSRAGETDDDVIDLVMRGNALTTEPNRKELASHAVALFKRALELDPDNADAMIGIASTRIFQVVNLYQIAERESLLEEAEALISQAMGLVGDHIGVMKARAMLLRARGRFADAIIADESVMALNPGEPTAYRELGLNNLYLGRPEEAVDWFRRADRVAPMDRERWTWLQGLGRALMQLGHDAEAAEALRLALHSNPHYVRGRVYLAAAESLLGDIGRAKVHLDKLAEFDPGMTIRRFVEERNSVPLDAVSSDYLRGNDRMLEGLRRVGMPEQ
jgi:TolB-like protein/cytochrome c-type biogenesis protein CcmH/NrfG